VVFGIETDLINEKSKKWKKKSVFCSLYSIRTENTMEKTIMPGFSVDDNHQKPNFRVMETRIDKLELFHPITLEELIGGRNFIVYREQIIFYHEELQQFVITNITPEKKYTATDYMSLPEGAPYQLIEGELIYMPSPFTKHQEVASNLHLEIGRYVKQNKLGKVFFAPLDVHLDEDNVYQPDILFVSIKRSSIIKKFIFGAPDFVVEILSKSTEDKDRGKKLFNYGKFGVDEYWIVNLNSEHIEVYHNTLGVMVHQQTAGQGKTITSKAINGFELNVNEVF
jgi:Uma2 family endonuclease